MVWATSLLALASLAVGGLAQSTCSGQQYNDLPGFPASKSGCYPLSYYRTSDLGNTSPDDAKSRCQAQCTADSQCSSVVAQVNKAADSNLYSGTCFLYAQGNDPNGPRRCADTAYLLLGYKKDATLQCFSSSMTQASKYCSSYLGIPVKTSTTTVTPTAVTNTATVTTKPTTITTFTATTTPTVTLTSTTIITTTVATSTVTATTTTSTQTTITATTSTTTTTTITTRPVRKRAVATIPPPACVTSNTPATRLSAACSCLSIPTSTSTSTTTLTPVTSTTTTTTTQSVTSSVTITTAALPVSVTTTITLTNPVTSTTTTTTTATNTGTTTVTKTSTSTATVTVQASDACGTYRPPPPGTYCGNNVCYYNEYYCAMTSVDNCGDLCASDNRCEVAQYASGTCVLYDGCSCAYNRLKRTPLVNARSIVPGFTSSNTPADGAYYDKATGKWTHV